ncbi:MAG: rhodanese-like domain-containing protein [Bacteroidia bacterium]|nr:rhodanese-like domain-containing protein [Bacteroidia bacterium]
MSSFFFRTKQGMKISPVIIVLILLFYSPLTGQVPDSVKFISLRPNEFYQAYLKEDKAIFIDVREFFEFRKARLKGAVNIPSSGNLEMAADTIDKQSALFCYCASGYRSKKVARYFYDKGFCKVYSLEGGIMAWKKDGMPVERKRIKRLIR